MQSINSLLAKAAILMRSGRLMKALRGVEVYTKCEMLKELYEGVVI